MGDGAPAVDRSRLVELPLRSEGGWRTAAWILAGWSLLGLLLGALENLARVLAENPPAPPGLGPIENNLLHAPLWTAATLLVVRLTRWFPLERGRVLRNGAILSVMGILVTSGRIAVYFQLVKGLGRLSPSRPDADFIYATIHYGAQDIFIYWAMVLAIHGIRYSRAVQEREVARAQLESQLVQAQLQTLKEQIQPHFLFNALNAIATLVRDEPARAERMVEHLSEMLRSTLAHHQAQEVPLRDELATLHPYLEIEKVRFGDRLEVQIDVDPGVMGARVPHLLLQPLVENAIRHGLGPRRRRGWVRIEVRAQGEDLRLAVEDNGFGMSGPIRPGAIGLQNVRSRLHQLHGDHHRFDITSEPDRGTRVEITIPLHLGLHSTMRSPALV